MSEYVTGIPPPQVPPSPHLFWRGVLHEEHHVLKKILKILMIDKNRMQQKFPEKILRDCWVKVCKNLIKE